MAGEEDMSKAAFRIAFDGDALASHTMDVRDLAPALLGLGEIFVEANRILNGKSAKVSVNVTPKIEENCFDIGIEILQRWEVIKDLLGHKDIAAAKDLLDWIFLNKEIAAGVIAGLFILYKKLRGKRPVNVIRFNDENGNPLYRYQFDGDEPDQIVDERVHRLYQSNKIRSQLGRLLRPVMSKLGVDEFRAYEPGKETQGTTITKREAKSIDFTPLEVTEEPPPADTDEPFQATLRVYSPVYDTSAPRWRFWYGKDHHYMDVSESNIRDVVMQSGGALIDDQFRVTMQRTKRAGEGGTEVEDFKVLEVLEFVPAFRQPDLLLGVNDSDIAENGNKKEED